MIRQLRQHRLHDDGPGQAGFAAHHSRGEMPTTPVASSSCASAVR